MSALTSFQFRLLYKSLLEVVVGRRVRKQIDEYINKEGMVAFKERDFIKAEILYLQAIEEAKKSNLNAELSATLNNLGLLKTELLQYQESEK